MAYGLTLNGFLPKSFEDITSEMEGNLTQNLGALNFDDNSIASALVDTSAEQLANLWQVVQVLHDSRSPSAASGQALDDNCGLLSIKRLKGTSSYSIAEITAENQTTIPAGSIVQMPNSTVNFYASKDIEISNVNCLAISIGVNDIDAVGFSIKIAGVLLQADTSVLTPEAILTSLKNLIDLNTTLKDFFVTSVNENILNITSKNYAQYFELYTDGGLAILTCTNRGLFTTDTIGAIPVPANSLTQIATLTNGWVAVNNSLAGITGVSDENDTDLRIRRDKLLALPGRGTVAALRAKLLTLPTVKAAEVDQNNNNEIDADGISPHSFLATVDGGNDKDIATAIYEYKPIGIMPSGNIPKTIKNQFGVDETMLFNRAVKVYLYLKINLTKGDTFDQDAIALIKSEITNQVAQFKMGQGLLYQSLFSTVYKHQGITNAAITLATNVSNSANINDLNFEAQNISIDKRAILETDITKIIVT